MITTNTHETTNGSQQTIALLKRQIRQVELGHLLQPDNSLPRGITSGLAAIDQVLPERGYSRGTLIEWLVPGSSGQTAGYGVELLSLQLAQRAMQGGGSLVVVDPAEEFYPLAARQLGIPLDRVVILRGHKLEDLYWSIDQALRCEAVAAVWCAATSAMPSFLVDLDERWHRRFQLSAEVGQSFGLFLRPDRVARQPSWSDIQWRVLATHRTSQQRNERGLTEQTPPESNLPDDYWARPISLQLLKCRGGRAGQTIHLNFDTRTGELRSDAARRLESLRPRSPAADLKIPAFSQTG
jgi:protein ImuA